MKKILYIFYIIGLLFSLQSCDYVGNLFGSTKQEQNDTESGIGADNSESQRNAPKTAEMQSQLQQRDSVIKALSDSLVLVKEEMATLQANIKVLKDEQVDLQNDKVGVKNLFVYLVIFTIVFGVLVIFFVKKLVKKSNLTEDKVKSIVEYMSKEHPEIVCGSVNLLLNRHTNAIDSLLRDVQALNSQISGFANKLSNNGGVGNSEGCHNNQQSWESQAISATQEDNKQSSIKNKVFYMRRPKENMEFDLSLKSLNPTEETLYRFELDAKRPNFANFYFDCNTASRVRWAWATKDNTLDRVCYATGEGNNGKFRCTAPGEAKLQDGKWIVTRKAVVIFD